MRIKKVRSYKSILATCVLTGVILLVLTGIYVLSLVDHSTSEEQPKSNKPRLLEEIVADPLLQDLTPTPQPQNNPVQTTGYTCSVPAQCGGGKLLLKDEASCKSTTCCGFQNGSWQLMTPASCIQSQAQEQAAINAKRNGDIATYQLAIDNLNRVRSSTQAIINSMSNTTQQFNQYSQQVNENIQNTNLDIAVSPQPTLDSGAHCFTTWDEYFAAHPANKSNYVAGLGQNPPCD